MGGALINYHGHDFELAKQELKEFSEKNSIEFKIEPVGEDGWFLGFTAHEVTGKELNARLKTILDHFKNTNTKIDEVIKEFEQVYNTFEALDKDYIQGILVSIKAAELASRQAKEGAEENQRKIGEIIDTQRKTIELLKMVKEKQEKRGSVEDLAKKVRYAYAIAGGAAILALFELFLLFYRQVL